MGVNLLSLPREILQDIAGHFKLAEWVQGPARTCHLLYHTELPMVELHCYKEEEWVVNGVSAMASEQHSHALACAGRHTGPGTTRISLAAQAAGHCLLDKLGQPGTLTGPSQLANVDDLELVLHSIKGAIGGGDIKLFAQRLLQRLPNLIVAKIWYCTMSEVAFMPLLHLRHLELGLDNVNTLDGVPFAVYFPSLETASISAFIAGVIPELDLSGCQHLTRLVLDDILVGHLSKPAECWLTSKWLGHYTYAMDASQLHSIASETNEVLLYNSELYTSELYPTHGLIAQCWPRLEVIRCDWSDDEFPNDANEDEEIRNMPDELRCLRSNSSNFPALRSILCGDYSGKNESWRPLVMKIRVPAELPGVEELMIATDRPLRLVFDSGRRAGEKLNTFYAVASEVRVDAAALLDMADALSCRGLTLSKVQAEQEHKDAPSQCLYVHASSTPQLSYSEAVCAVNARIGTWGRHHYSCGQCGACYRCLHDDSSDEESSDEDV